ncbi:ferredoxin [Streptomyces sp. GMY02]|uniref:ferredoxin n=1 Tax=Streptomyces sp. GMY02 TaxID=1333528 RepID=UPI001C2C9A22|nr:ferredoxin [Streptomyces sp. GMY02]QXE38423.1 ferredoxin [Streptomyces sp. GMY02]
MKINIDRDKCCGAGQCVLAAPNLFDQDDDGIVLLLNESPGEAEAPAAHEAAILCPAAAIVLED